MSLKFPLFDIFGHRFPDLCSWFTLLSLIYSFASPHPLKGTNQILLEFIRYSLVTEFNVACMCTVCISAKTSMSIYDYE